jgi:hypothetical protein
MLRETWLNGNNTFTTNKTPPAKGRRGILIRG